MPTPVSLISLKRTEREKLRHLQGVEDGLEIPDYNYGLTITLSHEELQKLGLAGKNIEAGTMVGVLATAMVSDSQANMVGEMKKRSLTLQFQNMQVALTEDKPNEAELIYGGKVAKS